MLKITIIVILVCTSILCFTLQGITPILIGILLLVIAEIIEIKWRKKSGFTPEEERRIKNEFGDIFDKLL